jgi:UDP-glucose 4-epimerase
MKTAIIGANGYLGRNLSFYLQENKIENYDFDLGEHSQNSWMNYNRLDVTDSKDYFQLDPDVNVVFFMAGLTGTINGYESFESYYNVNVLGLINFLNYVKEQKRNIKIIFPSTRLVYKGVKDKLLQESDDTQPKTIYAHTKLICEQTLEMYKEIFGIEYEVLRIGVPYGNLVNQSYSYGTLGIFIKQAVDQKNITIYGSGNLKRTFTHIEDFCQICLGLIKKIKATNSVYNIGGESISLLEVAQKVSSKYNATIQHVNWPDLHLRIETGDTIFDSSKIDSYLQKYNYRSLNSFFDKY